jgi:hypothetical protein
MMTSAASRMMLPAATLTLDRTSTRTNQLAMSKTPSTAMATKSRGGPSIHQASQTKKTETTEVVAMNAGTDHEGRPDAAALISGESSRGSRSRHPDGESTRGSR